MCSKPILCSKIALKGKTCSRLLKPQKVAPNAKSCSKVAEHNRDRPSGKPHYSPHKGLTLPSGRGKGGGGAVFNMTIARCNFRRRKLNFNAIFLGSSSSERDVEATQAHARTSPHDTFSRFAILASPFLVLRHGVESLDSSTEKKKPK